ncbi:MAG: hypothetical protein QXD31_01110 [Candidatus Caldarchaeum sp.]
MFYEKETEMYPDVVRWFRKLLISKFPNWSISVYDTSKVMLSRFLFEKHFHTLFPHYQTYEIEVDITGLIRREDKARLSFVECKLNKINLRDVSQLLGYSKVAKPELSLILSPAGVSDSINFLFNVHRRDDILYYDNNRFIQIAKWIQTKQDIDYANLLPKGSQLV